MGRSRDLETLRAYVEGSLDPEPRRLFEEKLRADPELAEWTEAYAFVRDATPEAIPPCGVRFEDLGIGQARVVPLRRRLVRLGFAAALFLATALTVWWWSRPPAPVRLQTLALRAIPVPDEPPAFPDALADHRIADEDGLVWIRDLERGRALARAASRPLLLFIDHPTCPICKRFEAGPFRDPRVIESAGDYVLVRLSWNEAPADLVRDPREGWPLFYALDADLDALGFFAGFRSAPDLSRWLDTLAGDLRERGAYAFPEWEGLKRLARLLHEAEAAASVARRWEIWSEVARADPDGPVGRTARAARERIVRDASRVLLLARDLPPDLARVRLEEAAARCEGTPCAEDLRRVADAIRRNGTFPELREAR